MLVRRRKVLILITRTNMNYCLFFSRTLTVLDDIFYDGQLKLNVNVKLYHRIVHTSQGYENKRITYFIVISVECHSSPLKANINICGNTIRTLVSLMLNHENRVN